MLALRSIAFATSSLLALLLAGCAGTVVDSGGSPGNTTTGSGATSSGTTTGGETTGSGSTGSGSTGSGSTSSGSTGTGTGTPPVASPLYGVSAGSNGALALNVIDTNTGSATQLAQIDGLSDWSHSLFVDETATHAYTVGWSNGQAVVATTNLATGSVTEVPFSGYVNLVTYPQPVGVTQEGLVVAVGETNSTDFNALIFLIDPTSGALTTFDQISLVIDSEPEFFSMIYDAPSRTLYIVYAEGGSSSWNLARYSFDTKAFHVSPSISSVSATVVLAGVLPDGNVAGVYQDNPQTAFLTTVEMNPVTGAVTELEHVSGPSLWSSNATVHEGEVWFETGNDNLLFSLDPSTGGGTQVALGEPLVLAHY